MPANEIYIGAEQVTSLSSSAALAPPAGARWAILQSRGAGVYISLDGTDATSADMMIDARVPVDITTKLSNVRLLQTAASAIVDVWYFG